MIFSVWMRLTSSKMLLTTGFIALIIGYIHIVMIVPSVWSIAATFFHRDRPINVDRLGNFKSFLPNRMRFYIKCVCINTCVHNLNSCILQCICILYKLCDARCALRRREDGDEFSIKCRRVPYIAVSSTREKKNRSNTDRLEKSNRSLAANSCACVYSYCRAYKIRFSAVMRLQHHEICNKYILLHVNNKLLYFCITIRYSSVYDMYIIRKFIVIICLMHIYIISYIFIYFIVVYNKYVSIPKKHVF